ncbi:MAG TPA: aldo/keto reductase, partial [Trebonia sp.]|nr:aldo/keto reductase [Trebonia sp.]
YNAGTRTSENLLAACEEAGMAFLPWKPIQLQGTPAAVAAEEIADERGITRQQVALAWALAHSPAMLPIPGTSKLPHLDENIDAAFIQLSSDESTRLESAAAPEWPLPSVISGDLSGPGTASSVALAPHAARQAVAERPEVAQHLLHSRTRRHGNLVDVLVPRHRAA